MYEWGNLAETVHAWSATQKISPEERNRFEYFVSMEAAKPAAGSLRHRAAAAVLRVAVALDSEAQAAFREVQLAGHR